ncbi:hypothetical protein PENSUB_9897 [Penicillium subrubescens]|uniref:Uncharacterized protein n=1 Tax=Penicillium subrubescens TaxID=1316194 RepID=A0A1Q5TBW7_9EURO|nr:hypothetical protein PENSUB_9897 [Penicillium subrubescens]
MGAIRKSSMYSSRRPDFRKQLQRALSLSSFESDETHSASEISIGNTTEDQHSMVSKSAESSVHSDSASHTYENQIGPELPSVAQMAEIVELPERPYV